MTSEAGPHMVMAQHASPTSPNPFSLLPPAAPSRPRPYSPVPGEARGRKEPSKGRRGESNLREAATESTQLPSPDSFRFAGRRPRRRRHHHGPISPRCSASTYKHTKHRASDSRNRKGNPPTPTPIWPPYPIGQRRRYSPPQSSFSAAGSGGFRKPVARSFLAGESTVRPPPFSSFLFPSLSSGSPRIQPWLLASRSIRRRWADSGEVIGKGIGEQTEQLLHFDILSVVN